MIDLHCHIMPGVDDGAPDLEASCEMGRLAAQSGVERIVATPHCNLPELPQDRELLMRKFDALDKVFQYYKIPVRIAPGSELLVRENLPQILRQGEYISLNGSRYLLVEFFFDDRPERMDFALEEIEDAGLVPVIAHPERYEAVQRDPFLAAHWFKSRYILQVNKGSILGRLGRGAHQTSLWLLNHGLAHVVASDAHSPRVRTTDMTELTGFLQERYRAEYVRLLLEENPRRILNNLSIPLPGDKDRD